MSLHLADGLYLVSAWKPIVLLAPFVAWAWFVSTVLDKHAARFHLGREAWNTVHLSVGVVALVAAVLIPVQSQIGFIIAFAVITIILAADIMAYVSKANKDDRVPEKHRIRLDLSSWKQEKEEKAAAKLAGKAELEIKSPKGKLVPVPSVDSEQFQVRLASEEVFIDALDSHASQVDLAPTGKEGTYVVSKLIDGVRAAGKAVPGQQAVQIIDFWKKSADFDLEDRRRPHWADVKVAQNGSSHVVRVSTIGTQAGMRLGLLLDPAEAVTRKPDELGLLDPQMEELKKITSTMQGVVLLGGLPDGGRTTLLYTIIKMHDAYTSNVQTVELEKQAELEGVRQNVFEAKADGPEFSTLTRSIFRRDPDVVGLAELPDAATAKEVCQADLERTRPYVSMKTDGALNTIATFVKAVGDPELAGESLRGVVAVKLMRKLCENCKVPYQPSPEMLTKLGLPADKVKRLFKKGGQVLIKNKEEVCPVCSGGGYRGQIGIFEVYALDDAERAAIKQGDLNALRAALRKKNLPTMQYAALMRAVEGVTSVEEVTRVTVPQAAKKAG